ncbi:MAG: hypothetical protein Kow0010_03850 [Dehalococcoidia bacterium]
MFDVERFPRPSGAIDKVNERVDSFDPPEGPVYKSLATRFTMLCEMPGPWARLSRGRNSQTWK